MKSILSASKSPAIIRNSILYVIFPLFFGACIYVLWGDASLAIFNWFDIIGLESLVQTIRQLVFFPLGNLYPIGFYTTSLTDFGAIACTASIFIIWQDKIGLVSLNYISSGFIMGTGREIIKN